MGQQIAAVLPQFDLEQAAVAVRERRAGSVDPNGNELLGYAGILMGGERDELRPLEPAVCFWPTAQTLQADPRPVLQAIALPGGMGDGWRSLCGGFSFL
jgi:hypothetical protein